MLVLVLVLVFVMVVVVVVFVVVVVMVVVQLLHAANASAAFGWHGCSANAGELRHPPPLLLLLPLKAHPPPMLLLPFTARAAVVARGALLL